MSEYLIVEKVVAYITHRGQLLVFRHTQFPDAGIQVPAGTVEPGEPPDTAVLREVEEESGLIQFSTTRRIGTDLLDLTPFGESGTIRRWFYHLEAEGDVPESWLHEERHPSDGDEAVIEFAFFWVPLNAVPILAVKQDAFLHRI